MRMAAYLRIGKAGLPHRPEQKNPSAFPTIVHMCCKTATMTVGNDGGRRFELENTWLSRQSRRNRHTLDLGRMKRIALAFALLTAASCVQAADLSRPAYKAPIAVASYSWAGFYLGAHVGWGQAHKDWFVFVNDGGTEHKADGFLGGGQIGFNWQSGKWVFGVEVDASLAGFKGSSVCPQVSFTCRTKVEWLATAAGRIGYAFDPILLYVKGGAAWAGDRFRMDTVFSSSVLTADQTRTGWTIGGGGEYALAGNWSAKIEYNYMDFGHKIASLSGIEADIDQQVHRVIFGLNYRFNRGY